MAGWSSVCTVLSPINFTNSLEIAIFQAVKAAQDPRGFEEDGFRDPDGVVFKEGNRRRGFLSVVAGQEANDNVSGGVSSDRGDDA